MNERLKQLRKALGLKQREVAEKLGVSVGLIGRWESALQEVGDARTYQICKEFRVNRVWFETGVGEMFEPDPVELSKEEAQIDFCKTVFDAMPTSVQEIVLTALRERLAALRDRDGAGRTGGLYEMSDAEVLAEMNREAARWSIVFETLGREFVLNTSKRDAHIDVYDYQSFDERTAPANGSVDFYRSTNETQPYRRRFYDGVRARLYDVDFDHAVQSRVVPHVHLWAGSIRSAAIRYDGTPTREEIAAILATLGTDATSTQLAAWRRQNGIDDAYIQRFATTNPQITTVKDVQALLSYGWEFGARYGDSVGYLLTFGRLFISCVETNGKRIEYATDNLDEFGEKATFGPYPLADVVEKWTITEFI